MIFLFPTELEAAPFRALCPHATVVISGVGMAATAATIMRLYKERGEGVRGVILAGIAGGYEHRCRVGEVVEVVSERVAELPERFAREYRTPRRTTLRGVTANTVCRCCIGGCGADIENMEGAALLAMAAAVGWEAIEIRAISNIVGEAFERWDIALATNNLAHTLKQQFLESTAP